MTGPDELLQVEQVVKRLITRFPSVSPVDIEHTVHSIHGRFANGRVRDYVPLLVEKAARREIAELVSGSSVVPTVAQAAEPTVVRAAAPTVVAALG
ncbi:three-helix bundle dimerization domain-containing protein [Rhodococcus kronopolitis]|uniref:Three-helix bundle dimerization domain-containing protein n=1 Tax=Rhodococcus kronopolitis TaxID=1460226 RepID=A0ABV9FW58_9NOCA